MAQTPPLDILYGPGTAAAFALLVSLAGPFPLSKTVVTEVVTERGSVYVEVTWTTGKGLPIGVYRLEYFPLQVHCAYLGVEPAFRGKGLLLHLMVGLEPWWPTLGIRRHTMSAQPGSVAENTLRLSGFHELPNGEWGCPIPSDRPHEYLAWVAAGSPPASEPAWRAALPRPEDVF
jgi:GNAT superfamily N-acetyltransferase